MIVNVIDEEDSVSSQSPTKAAEEEDSLELSCEVGGGQPGPEPTEKEDSLEYSIEMEHQCSNLHEPSPMKEPTIPAVVSSQDLH